VIAVHGDAPLVLEAQQERGMQNRGLHRCASRLLGDGPGGFGEDVSFVEVVHDETCERGSGGSGALE
jgi:hypothetical protein